MDQNEIKMQLLTVLDENEDVIIEIAKRVERTVLFRELREFREETNRRFEAMQQQMDKRFEAMQQQMDKRFEEVNRRFEAIDKRFETLTQEMRHGFDTLENVFYGLGSRWGVETEAAFRAGMRAIITKHFGGNVTRWRVIDTDGIVHGHPSEVEIDLAVRDGKHVLIEVAFGVTTGDVSELYRAGELYQKQTGYKPEMAIVTPHIRPEALKLAEKLGIEVYSE